MKIFDTHADIGMDILSKKKNNLTNILQQFHLDKLKAGDLTGVGMACFFKGDEDLATAKEMVTSLKTEILQNKETVNQYVGGALHQTKLNAMITIEGMCFIKEDASNTIQWLYDQGARIGSLCWNDENDLATGIAGNPGRGLTAMGVEVIKKMNQLNMIVDISHTNEKTFWDIIDTSTKPIMATHSNARSLSNVDRNLTDQQIKAIAQTGGLIGLVAAKRFVSLEPSDQHAAQLAKHAKYMAELVGVEHICIGFDYMDFLDEPFGPQAMAKDLQDASMSQNLIQALAAVGFNQDELSKIAYQNVEQFLIKHL